MSSEKKLQQEPIDFSNIGLQLEEDFDSTQKIIIEKGPAGEKPAGEARFMVSPKPPRERRNWKRFAIEGAVVMVVKPPVLSFLKPAYFTLGPVKDIGMKGLAIHYVDKNEEPPFKKSSYLSIMLPGGRIVVDKVPFKIVNTFKVAELPGGKEVWNLCVSFEKLLPMHRIQIETFIDEYGNELKSSWDKKKDTDAKG